jgi:hypothetical protein
LQSFADFLRDRPTVLVVYTDRVAHDGTLVPVNFQVPPSTAIEGETPLWLSVASSYRTAGVGALAISDARLR